MARYDVAIVGAGIAGCTAAIMYARAGLTVALLEIHADISTFKRLCTHFIQSSAVPTLRRLGFDREIEAVGGLRVESEIHTPFGWIRDPGASPDYGYNLRRSELDPLLRRVAAAELGVDLMLGARVTDVRRGGLTARRKSGEVVDVEARLMVGADGRYSKFAKLAGLPSREKEHGRWGYMAHFTGVPVGNISRLWLRNPEIAYFFPTDGGRTVLAQAVPKVRQHEFGSDLETPLREVFAQLPEAPDLSDAERVSGFLPFGKYPSIWRKPTGPGVALVGDAAMTADYIWGVGCGWAFQSAEWLADLTAPALLAGRGLRSALARYEWRHRVLLRPHQAVIANYASGRPFTALERIALGGATRDRYVADRVFRYGSRTMSPLKLLDPLLFTRALLS